MSEARSQDTWPEMALRSELHRRGLRYRLHVPTPFDGRRRIDISFPSAKLAVFVDGCFWHLCPTHAVFPKANKDFWRTKLLGNQARDRDTDLKLTEAGWSVVRVWEHEPPEMAANRIQAVLTGIRAGSNICSGRGDL